MGTGMRDITDIGFMNGTREDETEFDTHNETELALLWWEFCKENKLITYVEKGHTATIF